MTTSGSYDFSLNRNGLIAAAYGWTGEIAIGETPTDEEYTAGGQMLNLMLKGWQTDDVFLWLTQKITLFQTYNTASYLIGPSGAHASASIVKTEVATAAEEGDAAIVVDSITGISDGDYLGIELDDGTLQWTTVSGDPADATLVPAAVLTDDVAVDNHIYTYTTKSQRPLEVLEGRRIDADGNSAPLLPISRMEYMALSSKSTSGSASQFYYDPQLTNGAMYVWPACANVKETLEFSIKKPIMDFETYDDEGEFPSEWTDAIVLNLAVRLNIKLGKPADKELKELAGRTYFMAKTFRPAPTSTSFQPSGG